MKKCLTERSHGCWERGKQGPSSSSFHSLPRASSGPASQDKSFYQPKNPQGHHWAAAAVFGSPLHSPTAPKGIPAPELTHGSGSIPGPAGATEPRQDGHYSLKQHIHMPGAHPKGHSPWQLNLGLASDPLENKRGKQSNEGEREGSNHSTRKSRACQEEQSREGSRDNNGIRLPTTHPSSAISNHISSNRGQILVPTTFPPWWDPGPTRTQVPENTWDPQARATAMSLLLLQGWRGTFRAPR